MIVDDESSMIHITKGRFSIPPVLIKSLIWLLEKLKIMNENTCCEGA